MNQPSELPGGGQYKSLFLIGEKCLFQPNLNKINGATGKTMDPYSAVECVITHIHFSVSKVRYSIEVRYEESGKDYWMPIEWVDSLLICPTDIDDDTE